MSTFQPTLPVPVPEPELGLGLAPGLMRRLVAPVAFDCASSYPAPPAPADEKVDPLDLGGRGKRLPLGDDGAELPSRPEENRWIALGRLRGGVRPPGLGKRLGERGGGGGKKDESGAEEANETVDALPRARLPLAIIGVADEVVSEIIDEGIECVYADGGVD